MSRIRSKDTKPEILVRKWLYSQGYRYRLHRKELPGKPDIVLTKWNTAIFVNGCFFHHHENCKLAYIPKTKTEWWMEKFRRNMERDYRNIDELQSMGWLVLVIWECQTRNGTYMEILEDYFRKISPLIRK